MDIHRARFVPYPTSEISAVAFSRSVDEPSPFPASERSDNAIYPTQAALKLAIGRVNGDIEIWDPQTDGRWTQEVVFPGDNRSVDDLLWIREPDEIVSITDGESTDTTDGTRAVRWGQYRLFSISASPSVTEWDLEVGMPKRHSSGNFSEVWCFAAQPRLPLRPTPHNGNDATARATKEEEDQQSQDIIAGCEDGTLVLLSTRDGDLQYARTLARPSGRHARCMTVTWQTRARVVAGFADATIRVFDARTGATLRIMSLGGGGNNPTGKPSAATAGGSGPDAPRHTLVWKIRCLPGAHGDIVSGDSTGEVKVWDGRSYALVQRVRGHDADCVELAVGASGDVLFSGGLDGRLAVYRRQTNLAGRPAWAKEQHRRLHDGDVKTMAAFDGAALSVLVSGGSRDAAPFVVPLREYGKERYRVLPALPQSPPVTTATRARLLVSWAGSTVMIWRIAPQAATAAVVPAGADLAVEPQPARKLVAKLSLGTRHKIRSVSISDDGRVLATCTSADVKVFQLRKRLNSEALSIRKIKVPTSSDGARLVRISPDSKWLAIATFENEVEILRLAPVLGDPKRLQLLDRAVELERRDRKNTPQTGLDLYNRSINHIVFSSDSAVLAVSDLAGYIDTWILKGNEDPTAAAVEVDDTSDQSSTSSRGNSSDSDSDDDDNVTVLFSGQHWASNPSAHLLPKLDSPPLILTFRPTTPSSSSSPSVGNPGVHATRQHPHAHSHALAGSIPDGTTYNLWTLTARHDMLEFDVLAGRLSAWSRARRGPVNRDFAQLKDRAMGAVWDIRRPAKTAVDGEPEADGGVRERLWLYGTSWLAMVDVSANDEAENLADGNEVVVAAEDDLDRGGRERKRRRLEPGRSGAGDREVRAFREGMPDVARRRDGLGEWTEMDLDGRADRSGDLEAEGDGEDAVMGLMRLGEEDAGMASRQLQRTTGRDRKWFFSFRYRPILGMAPLEGGGGGEDGDGDRPLEVVIVERPQWDTGGK